MGFIKESYPFTEEKYLNGDLSSPEKARAFAVRHSVTHLTKSVGKLATEIERYDHGGTMNNEQLMVTTTKMLVSLLNLAAVLDMSPCDLVERVPQVMK